MNEEKYKELTDVIKLLYQQYRPDEDFETFELARLDECIEFLKEDLT